jgi:NADH:ubiquinone oxidoreductase subunit E
MIKVVVCVGSSCHIKGARDVVRRLQKLIADQGLGKEIDLSGSFCMGQCSEPGVSVRVGGRQFFVKPEETEKFFAEEVLGRSGK